MDTVSLNELIEGEKYHYVSAVSGEPGVGTIWFETTNGRKTYRYQDENGEVSECHPTRLNKFVKA